MPSNKKIHAAIFSKLTPRSLKYRDAMSFLKSLGAYIDEGRDGSAVHVELMPKDAEDSDRPEILRLHKPHPEKELKQYQVRDIRRLLENCGYSDLD